MTTAHRPTFDPARGKDAQRGPAYHQRLLPAHKTLKFRQATQGTEAEHSTRDLRAELLLAERRHYAKKQGRELTPDAQDVEPTPPRLAIEGGNKNNNDDNDNDGGVARGTKRDISSADAGHDGAEDGEDYEAKRRRVLEETRDIDADSASDDGNDDDDDDDDDDSDSDSDEDSEDETAELMRELAKIKAERAEQAAKEAAEKAKKEEDQREFDIARGNPLLNPSSDFAVKRRWDDDVVFKNQARGTEEKKGKEFVNDLLRSDFHRRFMSKYVR